MSRIPEMTRYLGTGFPRVSGDEPRLELQGHDTAEFSPRERG